MRTLAAFVLLLAFQDEAGVREHIGNLDSESVDVRASAQAALVKLGKAAVPQLEEALKSAAPEARARLVEILRAIADRERRAGAVPPGTRVSLQVKDRPVRDVLDELQRRAGTPLDLRKVPAAERVTVSLEDLPFWHALDEVCKAHGEVTLQPKEASIVLARQKYVARPRFISGPFGVFLQEIEATRGGRFGRAGDRRTQIRFWVAWEKKARPDRVSVRPVEVRDDRGTDLLKPEVPGLQPYIAGVDEGEVSVRHRLYLGNVPAEEAVKLARLRFEIALEFTLKHASVKFEKPEGAKQVEQSCEKFVARLQSCTRRGREDLRADFVLTAPGLKPWELPVSARIRDKSGKEYAGKLEMNLPFDEQSLVYMDFKIPAEAEPAELAISVPAEVHTERIEVDLKDVPLR